MADPRDWWIKAEDDCKPIATLPKSGGPYVLANADKSKTWLTTGASRRNADVHDLDPDDHGKLRPAAEAELPVYWANP
jgi:hypothetical protein